jgi:hypothetical protein
MRYYGWIAACLAVLVSTGPSPGREPDCCDPPQGTFLKRLGPVGGWHPYGGGLFHWWDPHCFPKVGAPDDYCRKPLPRVCWPPYPPFFTWGPPEVCQPLKTCPPGEKPPNSP